MQLDDDTADLLERYRRAEVPPLSAGTPEEARAGYDALVRPADVEVAAICDLEVPGPAGPVTVREYRPTEDHPLGVVCFFHGGGWVLSSVDGHDGLARRLALVTGCVVLSVEYRLAPEHPFPAPHEDCWAVTRWASERLGDWGAPAGSLVVAGDSAGGNLAAGVALRARDEGLTLALQVLVYPCLDPAGDRPSMRDNAEGYFLTAADMTWFWDAYAADADRSDPRAVPMAALDLRGVAPALIQTAYFDPLRDEGEAYARRLGDAGVPVTVTRYPGVVHGFVARWADMARALDAHAEIGDAVRRAVRPASSS